MKDNQFIEDHQFMVRRDSRTQHAIETPRPHTRLDTLDLMGGNHKGYLPCGSSSTYGGMHRILYIFCGVIFIVNQRYVLSGLGS